MSVPVHGTQGSLSVPETDQSHPDNSARHGKNDNEKNINGSPDSVRASAEISQAESRDDYHRRARSGQPEAVRDGFSGTCQSGRQRTSTHCFTGEHREREREGDDYDGDGSELCRALPVIEQCRPRSATSMRHHQALSHESSGERSDCEAQQQERNSNDDGLAKVIKRSEGSEDLDRIYPHAQQRWHSEFRHRHDEGHQCGGRDTRPGQGECNAA